MESTGFKVVGKPSHLEAFHNDLMEMGYEPISKNEFIDKDFVDAVLDVCKMKSFNGRFRYYVVILKKYCESPKDTIYTLPDDWVDALKHAKKMIEDYYIPEKGTWMCFSDGIQQVIGRLGEPIGGNDRKYYKLTETFGVDAKNIETHIKEDDCYHIDYMRKASPSEIMNHLLKEAERRGIKEGCSYYGVGGDGIIRVFEEPIPYERQSYCYDVDNDVLYISSGTGYIYCKGNFAKLRKKNLRFGDGMKITVNHKEEMIYAQRMVGENPNDVTPISFDDLRKFLDIMGLLHIGCFAVYFPDNARVKVGCEWGTMEELREIYNEINKNG